MSVKIEKITASEFKELDVPVLNEKNTTDRNFGLVSTDTVKYKIGWQSTDITPSLTLLNQDSVCAIGIDLIFVIFNVSTEKIYLTLALNYFFI